jgi:hypothetical protein
MVSCALLPGLVHVVQHRLMRSILPQRGGQTTMTPEEHKEQLTEVAAQATERLRGVSELEDQARALEAEAHEHLQRPLPTADDEPHLPSQQENGEQ